MPGHLLQINFIYIYVPLCACLALLKGQSSTWINHRIEFNVLDVFEIMYINAGRPGVISAARSTLS